jgi:outer membrane protein
VPDRLSDKEEPPMPLRLSFRLIPRPRAVLAALAALAASGAVSAQSLQALYEAARGYDATYLAARAQADSAQYANEQVKALNRPSVSLSAGTSRFKTDQPGDFGSSSGTNRDAQLSALQPLYNRTNSVTIDQSERAYAAALADLELAEQDLILRVTQAYFNVLAAQDALGTTRANKTAIAEQLASAKRNFEVGTATITDTREAQARYDLAIAQEITAENDLRVARIALDQQVGRQGVEPTPLAAPVQLPPVVPGEVDPWVSQADVSPTVRKARLAYDVAVLETQKARAGHLPTVDLVGGVTANRNSGRIVSGIEGTTKQAQVGLQLNLPLFTGFSVQNRIRETLLLEERSRNDLDAVRRSTDQTTRQAFLTVQSGAATVRALEAAEASNQLALEATQLGYKVGVRVNIDVLNAQTQLFTTQRDLQRARYDVILNTLRLRQAAGTLNAQDVNEVNRLLAP